jgi:hypothetical protein
MISMGVWKWTATKITYSERSGGVTSGSPTGTTVQPHTLIGDDLEQTTATEGLGVSLALNLQDVQRKQDNLSNADQTSAKSQNQPSILSQSVRGYISPASSCVHDSLASSLSEGIVEGGTVMLGEVVTGKGLTTVLVDTLEDLFSKESADCTLSHRISHPITNLVTSGVSQTGEEGGELAADGGIGVLLEDDLIELGGGADLTQWLLETVRTLAIIFRWILTRVWLLINRFAVVSTCKGGEPQVSDVTGQCSGIN